MRALLSLLALAVVLIANEARGFSVAGHEAIEAAVYRRLMAAEALDDGEGHLVSGREVLAYLIRRGALETPTCFEGATEACERDREERPAKFWPVLGSGEPDLKFSRQLGSNGQCFHFMARAEDVWAEPEDVAFGVPRRMSVDAYVRCTRALSELFARTVRAPRESNDDHRGLYALMHAVGDAFSTAHVERDVDGHILYLKPWRLRAWLPYALPGRWEAYRWFPGSSHHGVSEPRDEGWVRAAVAGCLDAAAYAVPDRCFTSHGQRAIAALTDLVLLVYRVARHAEPGATPIDATEAWRSYLNVHLRSAVLEPDVAKPRASEREWTPAFLFGFRWRPRPIAAAEHDLTFTTGTTVFSDVTLPLMPMFEIEGGCRRLEGVCRLVLGVQTSLFVPLTEGFSLGVTPFSLLGHFGRGSEVTLGAHVVRGELFLGDAMWLSIAGPKYESLHRSFDAELLAVSVGVAWDGELGRERRSVPLRLRVDERFLEGSAPTPATPASWRPPAPGASFKRDTTTWVVHVLGGTVLPEDGDGSYSVGGLEVLWDRDRRNRRAGLAPGARLDTSYRVAGDDGFFTLVGGPVGRAYLIPSWLALEIAPAQLDAGFARRRTGSEPMLDVGGEASLAVLPVHRLEIGVDSPRISYRSRGRVAGTNVGLRVGFWLE